MDKLLKNSWALFAGYFILMIAHGFQGNLLGVRSVIEDFNFIATGAFMSGYYRFPTIHNKQIVFTSEDDLWSVSLDNTRAIRLTTNISQISTPLLSPNGKWLAYIGREDGNTEVYLMPSLGGLSQRSLVQYFQPEHAYQVETIPGIKDMIAKYK